MAAASPPASGRVRVRRRLRGKRRATISLEGCVSASPSPAADCSKLTQLRTAGVDAVPLARAMDALGLAYEAPPTSAHPW